MGLLRLLEGIVEKMKKPCYYPWNFISVKPFQPHFFRGFLPKKEGRKDCWGLFAF